MGAIIASALATGAATYAARKATPQTVNENYNFGGNSPDASTDPTGANTGFNAKRNNPAMMGSEYLGTKPPEPGASTTPPENASWESGIGGVAKNMMANKFAGVQQRFEKFSPAGRRIGF